MPIENLLAPKQNFAKVTLSAELCFYTKGSFIYIHKERLACFLPSILLKVIKEFALHFLSLESGIT